MYISNELVSLVESWTIRGWDNGTATASIEIAKRENQLSPMIIFNVGDFGYLVGLVEMKGVCHLEEDSGRAFNMGLGLMAMRMVMIFVSNISSVL